MIPIDTRHSSPAIQILTQIAILWEALRSRGLVKILDQLEKNIPANEALNREYESLIMNCMDPVKAIYDIFDKLPVSDTVIMLWALLLNDYSDLARAYASISDSSKTSFATVLYDRADILNRVFKLSELPNILTAVMRYIGEYSEKSKQVQSEEEELLLLRDASAVIVETLSKIIDLQIQIGAALMDANMTMTLLQNNDIYKIVYADDNHVQTYCKFLEDEGYKLLEGHDRTINNTNNNSAHSQCIPLKVEFQRIVNFAV
jgi:hypothetical protein